MTTRKTVVQSGQELTKSIEVFELATSVDITASGDWKDDTQQSFDDLVTLIGNRAQPVILSQPESSSDLSEVSDDLTGSGFAFTFTTEHVGVFSKHDKDYNVEDEVGVLTDLLDGADLNGTELTVGDNVSVRLINSYK